MKIGISNIAVTIPNYFISVEELAKKRNISVDYALNGLGVFQARIPYKVELEDLAVKVLKKIKFKGVERFYIATESDSDFSKSIGVKILNQRLKLKTVSFQYKFACLAGMEALISACEYVASNTVKSAVVLIIDRSIYHKNEPKAEITQGCAAVALRIERNPKILSIGYRNFGQFAININDFHVPVSSFPFPIVNGDLTKPAYLECQKMALEDWKKKNTNLLRKTNIFHFFDYFACHVPFPKIVEWLTSMLWLHEVVKSKKRITFSMCFKKPSLFKEYKKELDKVRRLPEFQHFFLQKIKPSLKYSPFIGNSYNCSIFISLISILEKAKRGQKIFLGGYGSGAGSIWIAMEVLKNNFTTDLKNQIKKGKKLSIEEYENWRKKYYLSPIFH